MIPLADKEFVRYMESLGPDVPADKLAEIIGAQRLMLRTLTNRNLKLRQKIVMLEGRLSVREGAEV